jgi:hypothetical protein
MGTTVESLYQNNLQEPIANLEAQRKLILNKMFITLFIGLGTSVLLFSFLPKFNLFLSGLFFIILLLFLISRVKKGKNKLRVKYKQDIITPLTTLVNGNLVYKPNEGFDQTILEQAQLVNGRIDQYKSEDFFEGIIGDTKFQFAEVKAEEKQEDSNGKTSYIPIFRGLLFTANFNKRTFSKVIVSTDIFKESFGGLGKYINKLAFADDSMERIQLEDPLFEKNFEVYGEDQVEARYILSTSLMDRFNNLRASGKVFNASVIGNTLSLGVFLNKNLFEPHLFRQITNKKELEEFVGYIQFMTGIVEELNLNNRIYTT